MVLRGAQIHRCGQAKCSLFSTQSLPHDLARLYGRARPFTSANLGNVAGLRLESVQILADSHCPEIVHCDSVKTSRYGPHAVRMTSLTMRRSRNRVPMNRIIRRRP